jgi:hypothetical protein
MEEEPRERAVMLKVVPAGVTDDPFADVIV